MRRRILTIGATDVYLHLGSVLFGVYALLTGWWPTLAVSMLSILLHEGAHGVASVLCGQQPKEMELTPLGAVLRLEDEEQLPLLRRFIMIAAGPMMTLLLCFLALHLTEIGWMGVETGRRFFTANLAILMVNLLPALPLDGGRMLTLALSCFLRPETLRRTIRTIGTVTGITAVGASLWLTWRYGSWNWSLAAVGCFLLYSATAATTTATMAELRLLMDRKIALESRGYARVRWMSVLINQPMRRAIHLLVPGASTCFILLQPGTMKRLGWLDEHQLITAYLAKPEEDLQFAQNLSKRPVAMD